jgi:hypothetical protein
MSRMHNPGGFGSDNFLPRQFGDMSWCNIEMEGDTSKRLLMLPVAEIHFNAGITEAQKLRIIPYPDRQNKKTVDVGYRPNDENQACFDLNFLCFSNWENGPRWSPSRIIGVIDHPLFAPVSCRPPELTFASRVGHPKYAPFCWWENVELDANNEFFDATSASSYVRFAQEAASFIAKELRQSTSRGLGTREVASDGVFRLRQSQ